MGNVVSAPSIPADDKPGRESGSIRTPIPKAETARELPREAIPCLEASQSSHDSPSVWRWVRLEQIDARPSRSVRKPCRYSGASRHRQPDYKSGYPGPPTPPRQRNRSSGICHRDKYLERDDLRGEPLAFRVRPTERIHPSCSHPL